MNILSLFDGISCARVAIEKAGFTVNKYLASEVDKNAIILAMKNYPSTTQLGDVRGVTKESILLVTNNESIDLLIGGSPCQDLSIAQKNRKGLQGERSVLFWDYVRILNEIKPKWFVLENVASMSKESKDVITKTLNTQPVMIDAALVSAQSRKRLFWTNIPNITQPLDRHITLKNVLQKDVLFKYEVDRGNNSFNFLHTYRSDYGKTVRIGSLNKGGQADRIYSTNGKSVCLSANGGGRGAKTGLYYVPENSLLQSTDDYYKNGVVRKLTPIECERLQGLPDNYTQGLPDTHRYRVLGNAFNVDVVAHILKNIRCVL